MRIGWVKFWTLSVAFLILASGCSPDIPEPLEGSPADELGVLISRRHFDERELFLVSLLVPPSQFPKSLEVASLSVDTPNNGLSVPTDAPQPEILLRDCTFIVTDDQLPGARISYLPLDGGPLYSVQYWLLNDENQRDDYFETREEAAFVLETCSTPDPELRVQVPEVTRLPALDVEYPSFGVRYENERSENEGSAVHYGLAIEERLILLVEAGVPSGEVDSEFLETLIRLQLERFDLADIGASNENPSGDALSTTSSRS